MDTLKQLIQALQNPILYDHPTDDFSVIETHISFIILTGEYAYKIKKPLDLGFLDFSTLDKRFLFCQEEVRLNRKTAPTIYLSVVKITGSHEKPTINGHGTAIEYAVKMRQFPQTALFSYLLNHQTLTLSLIQKTAMVLADFHTKAVPGLSDNPYGTYEQIHEPVIQNFTQIESFLTDIADHQALKTLAKWSESEHIRLQSVFIERKQQGFIRECHGDIHLDNIVLIDDEPFIFDCIEFNDSFRWTDTMADIGFLVMDLEEKGQYPYANQLLSTYLQQTRDYNGLKVINYYKAYRAIVRAKVALFQKMQAETEEQKQACWQQYTRGIKLANSYCHIRQQALFITYGLTATGKSTVAEYLVQQAGFIHISSDTVRKQLKGLSITSQTKTPLFNGIYTLDVTDQVYTHLQAIAETVIQAGYPVIVDATFIQHHHRAQFKKLAETLGVTFKILHTHTDETNILSWLKHRQQQSEQISEAREDIYFALKAKSEKLDNDELQNTIALDISKPNQMEQRLQSYLDELR